MWIATGSFFLCRGWSFVKIHYKGFGEEADEWRDMPKGQKFPFVRLEKAYVPSNKSLEDRMQSFHERVYHEIKRRLWSGRRDNHIISGIILI